MPIKPITVTDEDLQSQYPKAPENGEHHVKVTSCSTGFTKDGDPRYVINFKVVDERGEDDKRNLGFTQWIAVAKTNSNGSKNAFFWKVVQFYKAIGLDFKALGGYVWPNGVSSVEDDPKQVDADESDIKIVGKILTVKGEKSTSGDSEFYNVKEFKEFNVSPTAQF